MVDVADLYDQFNYGEPSPVAIRRFADHVLSNGGKEAKYFFLIGKSITYNERIVRGLPNEVPSIGYPGSDLLLVEGLAGAPLNVPAAAIGRLTAFSNAHVQDYLQKIKEYEHPKDEDLAWRKTVLHISGGKSGPEVTEMKSILSGLAPKVENGPLGGSVKAFVKTQAVNEVIAVNITPEINNGVGMMSYIGHGAPYRTDYNMGYMSDPDRQYEANSKCALMYFNGCSVGNVFAGRSSFAPKPESTRIPLSLDWLLMPDKGAVAVIANSFDSYLSVSAKYLKELYTQFFEKHPDMPIGRIVAETARSIMLGSNDRYDVANVHQSVLQGDPALRIFALDKPDYAIHTDEGIRVSASAGGVLGDGKPFEIQAIVENKGRYEGKDKLDVEVALHRGDGQVERITKVVPVVKYRETFSLASIQDGADVERIEVTIDPKQLSHDGNRTNNYSELPVDWKLAKGHSYYPSESVKDIVPPVLTATFNGRTIRNGDKVGPEPEIAMSFRDDRSLPMDKRLFEISIKACGDPDCPCGNDECIPKTDYAEKIPVKLEQTDNRTFKATMRAAGLSTGVYRLAVRQIKDRAGNMAEPFDLDFRVAGNDEKIAVTVSPNPASRYIRFTAVDYPGGRATLKIFDKTGNLRHQRGVIAPRAGLLELYWLPDAPGDFVYRIEWAGGQAFSSGKFTVVE